MNNEEFDLSKVNTNVLSKERISKEVDAVDKSLDQLTRMKKVLDDIYDHSKEVTDQPTAYNLVPLVVAVQQIEPQSVRLLIKPLLKVYRKAISAQRRYKDNLSKFAK